MSHVGRHDCLTPPLSTLGDVTRRAAEAPARRLPRDPTDPRSPLARTEIMAHARTLARTADQALAALQALLGELAPEERAEALATVARQAPAVMRIVMPHYGRFASVP